MPVNQRVTKLIKYLNLKQKDFALAIGVSQSKISAVESGKQTLSSDMITSIIKKFNVDPEWLLGLKGYDDVTMFKGKEPSSEELERIENERDEQKRRAEEAERKNLMMMEELLKYKSIEVEELKADRALSPQV